MTQYRVMVIGEGGRELGSGYLFSADDESACASAERLLQSTPKAVAVQVRDGERLVCSFERG
jgi:hypothetical protein